MGPGPVGGVPSILTPAMDIVRKFLASQNVYIGKTGEKLDSVGKMIMCCATQKKQQTSLFQHNKKVSD